MKQLTPFSLLFFLTVSCSNKPSLTDGHIIAGRCEQEFKKTKLSQGQAIWAQVSETSSATASYLVTGLAYSTDFIVTFTGGVIGTIAVCSPVIVFEAATSNSIRLRTYNPNLSGHCIEKIGETLIKESNPHLGPKAAQSTQKWHCPSLDHIAEGLLKVADCYSEGGETELAKQQLETMNDSEIFQNCLPKKMKDEIAKRLK